MLLQGQRQQDDLPFWEQQTVTSVLCLTKLSPMVIFGVGLP